MTYTANDLDKLKWELLLLLACLLLIGGGAFLCREVGARAEQAFRLQERHGKETRVRLFELRRDEAAMRDQAALYQDMRAHGLIGAERRLEWVERMRRSRKQRKLIGLDYELSPQRNFGLPQAESGATPLEFMSSFMHLRLSLLHENDLLAFLDDLRSIDSAFPRIGECTIVRAETADDSTEYGDPRPQLLADCKIDWITLRAAR